MRFDELTLQDTEGELRVRFHAALTMLCGLGEAERRAIGEGVLTSVCGGPDSTKLHMTTHDGTHMTAVCEGGLLTSRLQDGSAGPAPLGPLGANQVAARSLMLLSADDLGALSRVARENEPEDLREARDALDALTAELNAAVDERKAADEVKAALARLEDELRAAHDGVARREYAVVLARLERVRAEAAAVDAGQSSVDSDRHLLASADRVRALVRAWTEVTDEVATLTTQVEEQAPIDPAERDALAGVPAEPPEDLDALIDRLRDAMQARAALDARLQSLSVARLPAPTNPLVAELGLLQQEALWEAAEQAHRSADALRRLQLSLGGLEPDAGGPSAAITTEIELAHARLEAAEQAAAAAKTPTMGAVGAGLAAAAIGALGVPIVLPIGIVMALVAAALGFVLPARRLQAARLGEVAALEGAGATSYLGFHIRRVEASVDPDMRASVETARTEQVAALAAWSALAGAVDVELALALRAEVEAYHQAVRDLGETADEVEELRRELTDHAEPALVEARAALSAAIEPYGLDGTSIEPLADLHDALAARCQRGSEARTHALLDDAGVDLEKATARLEDALLELGFDDGPLEARAGALDWAIARATEREAARTSARPRAEIDAELEELQEAAASLRRPEWAAVTAADAETPDIAELEARREELRAELLAAPAEGSFERLADRHATAERRVSVLEARHGGQETTGDPAAIAAIRQQLFTHLRTAATAGPSGDPVPVVLDEVLSRVPADRTWDLLDQLLRLAESHQLIYLSDDAFVAAWARKRALEGSVTLLELSAEPAA